MSANEKCSAILHLFTALREDEERRPDGVVSILNRWVSDDFLLSILKYQLFQLNVSDTKQLNRLIALENMSFDKFDGTNSSGVFRKKYISRYYYYIITEENMQATDFKPKKEWADEAIAFCNSHPKINNNNTAAETTTTSPSHSLLSTLANASSKKNLSVYHTSSNILNDKRQRRNLCQMNFDYIPNTERIERGTKVFDSCLDQRLHNLLTQLEDCDIERKRLANCLQVTSRAELQALKSRDDTKSNVLSCHLVDNTSNEEKIWNSIQELGALLGKHSSNELKLTRIIDASIAVYGKNVHR